MSFRVVFKVVLIDCRNIILRKFYKSTHNCVYCVYLKILICWKIENMYKLKIKLYKVISGRYLAHHKPSFESLNESLIVWNLWIISPLYSDFLFSIKRSMSHLKIPFQYKSKSLGFPLKIPFSYLNIFSLL